MTNTEDRTMESQAPRVSEAEALPEGASLVDPALPGARAFKYTYTTGPFVLPSDAKHIDWVLLNNDTTSQNARITVFACPLGAVKRATPPGPLDVTLPPGQTTHNANAATGGFIYEIQVETNSVLILPYASAWAVPPDPLPSTIVKSSEFIRRS